MRNRYRRLVLASFLAVVTAVSIVCFTAAKVRRKRAIAGASALADADKSEVEGIVFAVGPNGIDPPDVNLAKGSYLFIVQNRSGIRDLPFTLDRDLGGKR